jgi:hypothetical protein
MTDILLALAFGISILIGFWMVSRLDRFWDKRKGGGKDIK